jgi:hypothetical protein
MLLALVTFLFTVTKKPDINHFKEKGFILKHSFKSSVHGCGVGGEHGNWSMWQRRFSSHGRERDRETERQTDRKRGQGQDSLQICSQ